MLPVWIVLVLLPIFGGAERFNCRGRILGAYYADAKSGCKAFHVCVRVAGGGIRDFRFFCPPGTLFHQEAQTCTDWGDDDPLACPADLYDGQFDLYKIGSGYDTKKLSSQGSRDEEAEFGLQRAETGDRRLSQNNAASNGPASDLRAAHSSDFFSGQRERGRDDSSQSAPQPPAPRPSSPPRQSFRRPTTPRATPASTQYTTTILPPSPQPSSPSQYDPASKRKLIRKRPVYASTAAPSTFAQNTPPQQQKQFSQQPQQQFSERPEQPFSQQPQQQFSQRSEQAFSQQAQQQFSQQPFTKKSQPTFSKQSQQQPPQHSQQQYFQQPQQQFSQPTQKTFSQQEKIVSQQPQQSFSQQQNFNQRAPQNRPTIPTPAPPANVPPQYKDEYVEVSRVTPKQYNNRFYPNNPTSTPFVQSTPPQFNKKEGLAELYNYDAQSTPGLNVQNDNRPFKVRNSFSVSDIPKETDFVRTRGPPTTIDYNTAGTRSLATSTPAYKNFNSVSYEPEKNNFVSYSGTKQNYFNSPTTIPTTTIYTTTRSDPVLNLNTVAYNTNIALNTIQPANFAENQEDDGQYRPPEGEDDGQYKPELYERELLSGAHSLNIAASGNRLPEDQKKQGKSQAHIKPPSQTAAAPRPFKPAPTPPAPPTQTFRTPEPTYTTTYRPLPTTTARTSRTFDYYQTYTTTSRPNEQPAPPQLSYNFDRVRQTSTVAPRVPESTPRVLESRSQPRAPAPPTHAPQPVKPVNNKEDSSYDYAYYDSDPGFSEYDHIEEFGKTKTRT